MKDILQKIAAHMLGFSYNNRLGNNTEKSAQGEASDGTAGKAQVTLASALSLRFYN